MTIREVAVETPTLIRLRQRVTRQPEYLFAVGERELRRLRAAGLCPASILAYAAIRGAYRAAGNTWAAISTRTYSALGFPPDWWRVNTRRLERAGFVECDRQPGRLRRYRVASGECGDYSSNFKE